MCLPSVLTNWSYAPLIALSWAKADWLAESSNFVRKAKWFNLVLNCRHHQHWPLSMTFVWLLIANFSIVFDCQSYWTSIFVFQLSMIHHVHPMVIKMLMMIVVDYHRMMMWLILKIFFFLNDVAFLTETEQKKNHTRIILPHIHSYRPLSSFEIFFLVYFHHSNYMRVFFFE